MLTIISTASLGYSAIERKLLEKPQICMRPYKNNTYTKTFS